MTKKKLLSKLKSFLNPKVYKKNKQREELKKILKKLKKKEHKVKDKINSCTDKKNKKHLELELEIIRIQRKKGIAVLRGERPVKSHPAPDIVINIEKASSNPEAKKEIINPRQEILKDTE